MAIDSAQKRDSAMLDPGGMPWPPDGTAFTADRRLVMLEFYSGVVDSDGQPNYLIGGLCGRSVLGGELVGCSLLSGRLEAN